MLKAIIFLAFLYGKTIASQEFYFQTIGIYSECLNASREHTQLNNTNTSRIATFLNQLIGYFNKKLEAYGRQRFGSKLIVKSFYVDSCVDDSTLVEIVETILLDEKHHFRRAKDNKTLSSIGAIHTYMPERMTKTLRSLVHGVPIYDTNIEEILKDEFQLYTKSLVNMFQKFHWQKLLLLSLEPMKYDNFMYRELFQLSINSFKEEQICFHYHAMNESKSLAGLPL